METTVNLLQARLIDMRVDLRRCEAGVAQHFLDRTQVGAVAEQMGGKRVTQEMWPNLLFQAGQLRHFLDDLPDARGGQSTTVLTEKNFAARLRLD